MIYYTPLYSMCVMYIHIVCYYVLYMWSWSVFLHLENPRIEYPLSFPAIHPTRTKLTRGTRTPLISMEWNLVPQSPTWQYTITQLTVYTTKRNTYILPSWGLYATYHLFMGTRNNHWSYQNLISIQGWFKLGYKLVHSNSHGVKKPLNDFRYLKILLSHQL